MTELPDRAELIPFGLLDNTYEVYFNPDHWISYDSIGPVRDDLQSSGMIVIARKIDAGELDWKHLSPARKVQIIEAMGFSPGAEPHTHDCPRNISSGYICNCVPEPTTWSPPEDVEVHRGETYEQRVQRQDKRRAVDDFDVRGRFLFDSPLPID